jgi:ssDNA-binding Zn-finger/Zn-ribbon topoisomerase 1
MATKINTEVDLEVKQCPVCYVHYAVPEMMMNRKRENGGDWYCPNGHGLAFTKTKADKLAEELAKEKEHTQYWMNRKNEIDRELTAKKGELTKLKKRVTHGVCPCCNRSFVNLQRHMKTKHPEAATVSAERADANTTEK